MTNRADPDQLACSIKYFKKQLHKKQNLGQKKYGIKCSKFAVPNNVLNSTDPDQSAPLDTLCCCGSTLFAQAYLSEYLG